MKPSCSLKRSLPSFTKLLQKENLRRREDGILLIPKAEVTLLGQMSLLLNDRVSMVLSLAQTGDMDAHLRMEHFAKQELKKLLQARGWIYDEDSDFIWLPSDSTYEDLFHFDTVKVRVIDSESALVSKAVKAPEKNKQLIRQAIASGEFPKLVDRILENGGDLTLFA
jgi:hypothetical protein